MSTFGFGGLYGSVASWASQSGSNGGAVFKMRSWLEVNGGDEGVGGVGDGSSSL